MRALILISLLLTGCTAPDPCDPEHIAASDNAMQAKARMLECRRALV